MQDRFDKTQPASTAMPYASRVLLPTVADNVSWPLRILAIVEAPFLVMIQVEWQESAIA